MTIYRVTIKNKYNMTIYRVTIKILSSAYKHWH